MPTPTPQEQEQAQQAYRDQVNWRAVTRADPAVQQILNTCTFCSVFIFDKVKDVWVKQNQEGPLFLIKRNKEPEYGLYMLNRATVKNVLWPLIPGEMRVTPTKDEMLIVERRGEGIRTGIHFADGMAAVKQFESTIISLCGDPRKQTGPAPLSESQTRPQSQPQPQSPQQAQPPVQPQSRPQPQSTPSSSSQPQGQDDLARLFSGIMSIPATGSPARPPSATNQASLPVSAPANRNGSNWETKTTNSASTSTQTVPGTYTQTTQTQTVTSTYRPSPPIRPDTPPSPPITFSELPISPPSQSPRNTHPPGQTVADLLASIGGGPSRSSVSPPPGPPGQTVADLLNSISGGSNFAIPPPIPPHPPANPTRGPSYSHSPTPPPPQAMRSPPPPPQPQAPPVPLAQKPRDRPPHLDQPAPYPQLPSPGPDPRTLAHMQEALLDTLPTNYQPAGPDPRAAFQRDVIDLLQRNPVFVDQLFQAYLARRR